MTVRCPRRHASVRRLASKKKNCNFHIFTYILQPHLMARVKTASANTHRLFFCCCCVYLPNGDI